MLLLFSRCSHMEWEHSIRRRRLFFIRHLGSGASGDTYLVHDRYNAAMALKRSKQTVAETPMLEEVLGMRHLCSWHTTKLHDAWVDQENRVNILMEYCDGGTVSEYVRQHFPLSEEAVMSIFTQVLLGLDHLHKKGIIHRDIKLDNILLSSALGGELPSVKLADYGLSTPCEPGSHRTTSHVGTPLQLPPEVTAGYACTTKSDVWSLGVVLYMLLTNRAPVVTCTARGVSRVRYVAPPNPTSCTPGDYPSSLGGCVLAMLHEKWKRRPSAEALLRSGVFDGTLLRPPWVSNSRLGLVWAYVPRHASSVTVYNSSSTSSPVAQVLTYGDQVLLSRLPSRGAAGEERWILVEVPFMGFIPASDDLYQQLESFSEGGLAALANDEGNVQRCRG